MLSAVADEGRLQLMEILTRHEACVGDIAKATGALMSTVSERLRRLRASGLVITRRQGKHKYYSIADGHIAELVISSLTHASEDEFTNQPDS